MATESSDLVDRAEYYRQLADLARRRAASTNTPAARHALAAAANDYELLAHYAESLESTWQSLRRRPDE